MAIEFVKCRRVDNPEVTADIAVSALPHLTGWERIPEEELRAAREAEQAARLGEAAVVEVTKQPPAPEQPPADPEPEPEPQPEPGQSDTPARSTTRKSRSRAANEE